MFYSAEAPSIAFLAPHFSWLLLRYSRVFPRNSIFSFADHFLLSTCKGISTGAAQKTITIGSSSNSCYLISDGPITTAQHLFIHLFFWLPGKFSTVVTVRNSLYSGCIQPSTSSSHLLLSAEVLNLGCILESPRNLRTTKPGSHPPNFWCNESRAAWSYFDVYPRVESLPARTRLPYPNLFNRLALTPTVSPFSESFSLSFQA